MQRSRCGFLTVLIVGFVFIKVVTARHVHLRVENSLAATQGLKKRTFGSSVFYDHPDTPWYYVDVLVGEPAQKIKLAIDQGETTWLPWLEKISTLDDCDANYEYNSYKSLCSYANISGIFDPEASKTFENRTAIDDQTLYIDYTSTKVHGTFGTDTLQLNQLSVTNQTIGLASNFSKSPSLGVGVAFEDGGILRPSFLQNLYSQGKINSLVWSLFLNDIAADSGDIYFGAIDESRFYGELQIFDNYQATSVGEISLDGVYWIDKSGLNTSLATVSTGSYKGSGSIFFGTTSLSLPEDIYDAVLNKLNVRLQGNLYIQDCSAVNEGSLVFLIQGVQYTLSAAQLFSPDNISPNECYRYMVLGKTTTGTLAAPRFRFGDPFLRAVYAVFDYTNNQTGIAPARVNATGQSIKEVGQGGNVVSGTGTPNPNDPTPIGPGPSVSNTSDPQPSQQSSGPPIGAIVGGVVGGVAIIAAGLVALFWIRKRSTKNDSLMVTNQPPPPPPDNKQPFMVEHETSKGMQLHHNQSELESPTLISPMSEAPAYSIATSRPTIPKQEAAELAATNY